MHDLQYQIPGRSFHAVRDASLAAAQRLERSHASAAAKPSLVAYIQSRCQHTKVDNVAGLESLMRLDEMSRRLGDGTAANGVWFPLSALRDLTLTSASALVVTNRPVANASPSLTGVPGLLTSGATVLGSLSGSAGLSLPTVDTGIDATGSAWVVEGSAAPQREPTFGLRPVPSRFMSIQVMVSRRLLAQNPVDIEAVIAREILTRFSLELDRAAINGNGVAEPLGLLGESGLDVLSAGANGAAPTWQNIVDLESAVEQRAGSMVAPRWIMHPVLRKKLRTTQRAAGLDFIMAGPNTLCDRPVTASTMVPTTLTKGSGTNLTAMIYGDMSELVIGFWSGPIGVDLIVDTVTKAKDGRIVITAVANVGVAARRVGAFAAFKDLISA